MIQRNDKAYIYAVTLLFTLVTTFLLVISCGDSLNGPEDNYGRRDYEWQVDTIDFGVDRGYKRFSLIWGSSYNDVWAFAHGSEFRTNLWHFDGQTWSTDSIPRTLEATQVLGFSQNSIWVSAAWRSIWHFDGHQWYEHYTHENTEYDIIRFNGIWGKSENDIYACGWMEKSYLPGAGEGFIIHYDGSIWETLHTNETSSIFYFIAGDEISGDILINGSKITNNNETWKIFRLSENIVNEIYSGNKYPSLYYLDKRTYVKFLGEQKIYKYKSESLELWKDFSSTNYKWSMTGRNEQDFFCVTEDGFGHYNGKNLITIFKTETRISNQWVGEDCVFAILEDQNTYLYYMLRGKLKN
ncbi:MAG: hypothetical protein JW995_05425 [Melioribacteraceae bacterium]|nr:hypothetical protein [Melioribacteraceae bacterium]